MKARQLTELQKEIVRKQVRRAKEEYRWKERVEPATVSSLYSLEVWEELMKRYLRFCYYMRETRHNWKQIDIAHYADNSTEVTEVSQLTGQTRTYMTSLPSGDICY